MTNDSEVTATITPLDEAMNRYQGILEFGE